MITETEICCFTLESALVAHEMSVDRVELCGGFLEGGTTPSNGLIKLVLDNIDPKTYVMIRPRGGDFCYSEPEILTIYSDILSIKKLNPSGFVFGALKLNGSLDIELCKKVISWAKPLPVTFHRAFDQCANPFEVLTQIIDLGFERILTSGQSNNAKDGLALLAKLTKESGNRIQIMAGAGVNANNAIEFMNAGIKALHFTAKEWQKTPMNYKNEVSMQADNLPDSYGKYETSPKKVKDIIQKLTQT
jgi:copper homeostasis protein